MRSQERGESQGDGAVAVPEREPSCRALPRPAYDRRGQGHVAAADAGEAEDQAGRQEGPLEPWGAALQRRAVGEDGEEPVEGRAEEPPEHRAIGLREPEPPAREPGEAVREARRGGQAEEEHGEQPGVEVLEAIEKDRKRDGEQNEREEHRGAEQQADESGKGRWAACGRGRWPGTRPGSRTRRAAPRGRRDRRGGARGRRLPGPRPTRGRTARPPRRRGLLSWQSRGLGRRPCPDRRDLHPARGRAVLDVEAELDHPPGEGVVREPEAVAQDVVAAQRVARPQPAIRDPRRRESRRRGEPRDPKRRPGLDTPGIMAPLGLYIPLPAPPSYPVG